MVPYVFLLNMRKYNHIYYEKNCQKYLLLYLFLTLVPLGLGYASAAQFGLMETGDCEMMSKPMAAAVSSATTYHRFAFGNLFNAE